jgi:hypothetical protein
MFSSAQVLRGMIPKRSALGQNLTFLRIIAALMHGVSSISNLGMFLYLNRLGKPTKVS